ncbi:hypothetical protein AMAG_06126 [Allomyces macrogynus ATCC 38327]|uniref:PhoD-like phosphatase metallophosphatase domain-containing protein n=1 Tax=Allomyces macrogynus (strain ATCC 38327) TaxID=578462 RepID=A0A0L0SDZ3_ALLM3|nr:hypothetical protein AMAG_06126 [Allomyces macrogynus ATCC 38327]|eukprot:KNE60768.1 hypothetical protein AMAG_06126 [Allomyces macrogynus ATCC 38327]
MPPIRHLLAVSAAAVLLALATSVHAIEFSASSFAESKISYETLADRFQDNLAFQSPVANFPGLSTPFSAHHLLECSAADLTLYMCRFMVPFSTMDQSEEAFKMVRTATRKLVITACHDQFQHRPTWADKSTGKISEEEFEEVVKIKGKALGNMRFVAELFNFQVISVKVMVSIVKELLQRASEEDLECLMTVMTTAGRRMDHAFPPGDMDNYPPVGGELPASRDPIPDKTWPTSPTTARAALLHAQKPWIVVWDDHEFANDAWIGGAENQNVTRDGPWDARKVAAMRAFHENIPIRPSHAHGDEYRVYRSFQIGNLVDLLMLDTRMDGRTQQGAGDSASRKIMGAAQEQWLHSSLKSSKAKWRIIGNQIMFATLPEKIDPSQLPPGLPISAVTNINSIDTWNGYPTSRKALLDVLYQNKINNTVMLTGDFHGSVASDIPADGSGIPKPNAPSVMTEFVGPSITSASPALDSAILNEYIKPLVGGINPSAKWADLYRHGYMFVAVTPAKLRVEYTYVKSIKTLDGGATAVAALLETASGSNRITTALQP